MRAFVLEGNRARLAIDKPRPEPRAELVRVRTTLAGICNTDLELVRGYMGFNGVLGHEFVGEAVDGKLAGRRVVGGINFGCGDCPACERDLARHCPNRSVLGILGADGVMAEEFLIPERNLRPLPDTVDDTSAVFAEPVAAACEILDQLDANDRFERAEAVVIGAGKLGPLIAQVLATDGFAVTLVGRHMSSLEWLADRGVRLADNVPADGACPLVIEATGSAEGLTAAIAATAPRGTLVLKTTVAGAHEIDLAPVVINEINIVGSRCGRLEPAIELIGAGAIETAPLIDADYDLGDVEQAFERAAERGTRKVVVRAG